MSSVKSRREQYSELTKAALIDAATRRFAEHGYAATALDDVAADIQATRGAVYHHFASKAALFQAVFEELETGMIRRAVAAGAGESDPKAAAQAALGAFLDCCCEPAYGRVVWQEAPIALGWRRWKESEEQYAYGLIEQTVRGLMASGDLPDLPPEPVARVIFHLFGAAGMAIADAAVPDKARVRAEYEDVINRMIGGMGGTGGGGVGGGPVSVGG
jgi:AcrR family transcriptional regulator